MYANLKPRSKQGWVRKLCLNFYSATLLTFVVSAVLVFAITSASAQKHLADLEPPDQLPGVKLAKEITLMTGVAISPMLGVSSVSALRYYRASEVERESLPWYCHPAVWGTGFLILILCFLKDSFGTVVPPLIKKPFDMAELFESKASALVTGTAVIPFMASQMAENFTVGQQAFEATSPELHYASMLPMNLASMNIGAFAIFLPLCLFAFFVVWLTTHCINVLIALCPFGFIDGILKLVKVFLLSSVALSYFINPYFGAVVSLSLVIIAVLLAPWAFRLTVFGTILAADTIFPRRFRRRASSEKPHAFLARSISKVPVRTFGRVSRGVDGVIRFHYRPWLVFNPQVIVFPVGTVAITKGAFYPTLLYSADGTQFFKVVMFPPRYRGLENAIGQHLGTSDIRDGKLIKGFKAARAWLTETINFGKAKYARFQSG
ncbi:MAG: hypothetical protein KA368_22765 [Acidobacteria bacterium]|nr:hypothetical protein [Acidobacteriota bacterium]